MIVVAAFAAALRANGTLNLLVAAATAAVVFVPIFALVFCLATAFDAVVLAVAAAIVVEKEHITPP